MCSPHLAVVLYFPYHNWMSNFVPGKIKQIKGIMNLVELLRSKPDSTMLFMQPAFSAYFH
jgi:hypothetical protein